MSWLSEEEKKEFELQFKAHEQLTASSLFPNLSIEKGLKQLELLCKEIDEAIIGNLFKHFFRSDHWAKEINYGQPLTFELPDPDKINLPLSFDVIKLKKVKNIKENINNICTKTYTYGLEIKE